MASGALGERIDELRRVLGQTRHAASSNAIQACQHLAHQVFVIAEREGFREVASAVWHVEDALLAMHAGDLPKAELTWRQIDAACRAASAACELAPTPANDDELNLEQRAFLLLSEEAMLAEEAAGLAARKRITAHLASSKAEALSHAISEPLEAVIVAGCRRGLAQEILLALSSVESCRDLPVVVIGWEDNFEARFAAATLGASTYLPVKPDAEQIIAAFAAVPSQGGPARVLVLGDAQIGGMAEPLAQAGFAVHRASAPSALLETLERIRPDALVLGHTLHDCGARALCRMVRAEQRWRDLPILALAPRDHSEEEVYLAHQATIDDVLTDPVDARELSARIAVRVARTKSFQEQSNRDLLTGLLTRRAFLQAMRARLAEAKRNKKHLSICLCDIDKFKQINDTHGHSVGDDVLASFGHVLGNSFRVEDIRARWGGEEFVVAFLGEWAESAREILSRATSQFAKINFSGADGQPFNVTVSAGIATYPVDGECIDDLLSAADQRLYAAKFAGRNRIRL